MLWQWERPRGSIEYVAAEPRNPHVLACTCKLGHKCVYEAEDVSTTAAVFDIRQRDWVCVCVDVMSNCVRWIQNG